MALYLHDWAEDGQDGMLRDFGITPEALEGVTVIVASYTFEDYSGSAFVLFEKGGKLYEVNGSHCSCFGLEGQGWSYGENETTQWQPEEVDPAALRHRADKGWWDPGVADAVRAALDLRSVPGPGTIEQTEAEP